LSAKANIKASAMLLPSPLGPRAALAALLLCAGPLSPVLAADPLTLKEILSKAQTEAETKAVGDLVDKLRGGRPKPPDAAPAAAPEAAPPTGTARAPDAPEHREGAATPPVAEVAPPQSPPGASAPEATPRPPEEAIAAAEDKRLPSVDLEVPFAYNSDTIDAEAVAVLRTLGAALRDPSLADDRFLIAGHTDAKGGQHFNLDLSRRRAESVRRFLVAQFGIAGNRLVARGFGLTHLKNRAEPLAAENRRVQIVNLSRQR
jgi:outer membrane protein OmpA-like peptidoglycan-associated protein